MQNIKNNTYLPHYLLLLFIGLHFIGWTLLPTFTRYNLPLDAIEGAVWGHQLEWGYDKNPFLNAWFTAAAIYMGKGSDWTLYLFSQLSVLICFLATFSLAKKILPFWQALIAVLLLEGMQYYNFHAIDFNDNTLELATWGLTIYFFYQAITLPPQGKKIGYWLGTGLVAALGVMAKYYTLALLAAMFLFLLQDKTARQEFRHWPLYAGIMIFILVVLPHFIWLYHHDFITVDYVFQRTTSERRLFDHLYFPLEFAWQQFQVLIPTLILFSFLLIRNKKIFDQAFTVTAFNRRFLWFIGLGPFILTLILALCLGIKLRAGWGMPLFSLFGIILLDLFKPNVSQITASRFFLVTICLMLALLLGYYFSLRYTTSKTSANFPGRVLAQTLTERWHEKYHRKLAYVAGPRWLGGNILFYSADHPQVWMEWNHKKSPWMDLADLNQKGGIFVWEIAKHPVLPAEIRQQYSRLEGEEKISFAWMRGQEKLPRIEIGVIYLPPKL